MWLISNADIAGSVKDATDGIDRKRVERKTKIKYAISQIELIKKTKNQKMGAGLRIKTCIIFVQSQVFFG